MHLATYMHMVVLVSSCGMQGLFIERKKKREVQVQPLTIMYVFLYPEEGKAAGSRRATTVTFKFEVSLSWIIQELKFLLFFFHVRGKSFLGHCESSSNVDHGFRCSKPL